jgi:nicotinamidase-related amidase
MTDPQPGWEQFALLLIDVQRDFWTEKSAQIYPDFPANVEALLSLCRNLGIEVVHVRASFEPDMSDWMPTYQLMGGIPCVRGTAGEETLPFAAEIPGEKVILKHSLDGFFNPELFQHLSQKGKRFVLTAGLVTSVCVLLTTASAMQKGFLAAVIEDCCADEPHSHQQTLDRYPFVFERTTVRMIASRQSDWLAALKKLDEIQASI